MGIDGEADVDTDISAINEMNVCQDTLINGTGNLGNKEGREVVLGDGRGQLGLDSTVEYV